MIPSVVRSRIPVLTSLRQTAKTVALHGSKIRQRGYTLSCADTTQEKGSFSSTSTTDSSRATTPTLRPGSPEWGVPPHDLSLAVLPPQETRSGVDWDVAHCGVRLWVTAKSQAEQGGDPMALRSMHIDAVRYMHMALPSDLTPLEIESLRASMSPQLFPGAAQVGPGCAHRQPNRLRQSVAQAVCWVVSGLLLLLPIFVALLQRMIQFERRHRVAERLVANGAQVTYALGDRGIELHQAIVRFRDGPLGGACVDSGLWFIEGFIGGFHDGLEAVAQNRTQASRACVVSGDTLSNGRLK
jgi:hypothetical protein